MQLNCRNIGLAIIRSTPQLLGTVLFSLLSALAAVSTYGQTSADTLTFERVIAEVVTHNDRIAAARYMQESAERRASSAGVWDDPMLMLGVQNVPTNFDFEMDPMTMKMVGLSQTIPYSGYKGLERKAARAEAQAAEAGRRETEVDLVAAAKTAYYDLYYFQQNLRELQSQREILQQVVTSSMSKLRTNQAGQDEVLTAQADVWRLETSILSTEQEITAQSARLNSLRGADPSTPTPVLAVPPQHTIPDSVGAWLTTARANYPPLVRAIRQAESYGFSARAARRMTWPMLSVEAAYGFRSGYDVGLHGGAEPRDNMISLQANISLPIFSRGKQRAMARSMQAMQRGSEAEAAQIRRDVEAELITLFERARRLEQALSTYRNQIIPATEDAFRSALAGYTANRTTFVSLSSYSLSLYRDRVTANQLANDLARTLVEVDRYTNGTEWEIRVTRVEDTK